MNVVEVTDDELLLEMSYAAQNPKGAEAALTVFYQRYKDDLLRFSESLCREKGFDAEQFMLETFTAAYQHADRFNCVSKDPELIRKMIKSWLFTTLRNRFYDELRATRRERGYIQSLIEDEQIDYKYVAQEKVEDSPRIRPDVVERANRILESLSPRDQEILGLSIEYRNRETGNFEIPEDLLNGLADRLGVLPSSIKTLRHRIISRIQQQELQ